MPKKTGSQTSLLDIAPKMRDNAPSVDLRPLIERILDREGGVSVSDKDRGGVTNWGITRPFLSDLLGHSATDDDVLALSRDDARRLYLQWATYCRFDAMGAAFGPDPLAGRLMDCILDWAVNAGAHAAITLVQGLVGVKQDGVIGPDTLKRCALRPFTMKQLVQHRLMVRANQCTFDPSQVKFLNGWIKRDLEFL